MTNEEIRVGINGGSIVAKKMESDYGEGIMISFETDKDDTSLVFVEVEKDKIHIFNYDDLDEGGYSRRITLKYYDICKAMGNNPIMLTAIEAKELYKILYDSLLLFAEYHADLEPNRAMTLDELVEYYCYWGDEYNEGYIRELDEQKEKDNRLAQYLAYEFKKYRGEV